MAFIVTGVNRHKLAALILFALSLALSLAWPSSPARAEEPYVVAPVQSPQDLRLLPASAWHPGDADQNEMLLKLSYLRGLLDGMQYMQVAPKSSIQALTQLKGQGLQELVTAMDAYYLADPRRQEPPVAVLLRILPEAAARAAAQAAQPAPSAPPAPGTQAPSPPAAPTPPDAPAPAAPQAPAR